MIAERITAHRSHWEKYSHSRRTRQVLKCATIYAIGGYGSFFFVRIVLRIYLGLTENHTIGAETRLTADNILDDLTENYASIPQVMNLFGQSKLAEALISL